MGCSCPKITVGVVAVIVGIVAITEIYDYAKIEAWEWIWYPILQASICGFVFYTITSENIKLYKPAMISVGIVMAVDIGVFIYKAVKEYMEPHQYVYYVIAILCFVGFLYLLYRAYKADKNEIRIIPLVSPAIVATSPVMAATSPAASPTSPAQK
uniref:Uncharacterized protein n=1 Tax=Panagrolaimus sp. JU765 TaxID=591449 RepID=A0AC34R5E0_9BILA